ncbi:winged helix-turn-helix transcriptional regulator [Saccharopolyspora sp. 5N102]|uniref:winged helix-turn-helix transcriptional regulator n=1 Tax=Saccharopolyspora sp. 5N102 TaxID=3375155 RepID=UPI0037907F2D
MTPSAPVRVDYALTGLGESLLPVVQAAKAWANPTSTRSTGPPAPPTTAAEQPR